jgi:putative addiction module component (TIGR02574 family)
MPATANEVLGAALELPEDERLELVEALIVSFQGNDSEILDERWRDEIRRRSSELASGQVTSVPWAEVKRQAREAVGD